MMYVADFEMSRRRRLLKLRSYSVSGALRRRGPLTQAPAEGEPADLETFIAAVLTD